jgi:hypothetical protein
LSLHGRHTEAKSQHQFLGQVGEFLHLHAQTCVNLPRQLLESIDRLWSVGAHQVIPHGLRGINFGRVVGIGSIKFMSQVFLRLGSGFLQAELARLSLTGSCSIVLLGQRVIPVLGLLHRGLGVLYSLFRIQAGLLPVFPPSFSIGRQLV